MYDPKLGLEKTPPGYKDEKQENEQIWLNQNEWILRNPDFSETVKFKNALYKIQTTGKHV